jgi:hypothetical protein
MELVLEAANRPLDVDALQDCREQLITALARDELLLRE